MLLIPNDDDNLKWFDDKFKDIMANNGFPEKVIDSSKKEKWLEIMNMDKRKNRPEILNVLNKNIIRPEIINAPNKKEKDDNPLMPIKLQRNIPKKLSIPVDKTQTLKKSEGKCSLMKLVDLKYSNPPDCRGKICRANNYDPFVNKNKKTTKPSDKCKVLTDCITVVVKTTGQNKHQSLRKMIESAWSFYDKLQFFIVDDFFKVSTFDKELLRMITTKKLIKYKYFGYGVDSATGKNLALEFIETKYILVLNDDFIFTAETNLQKLVDVLETTSVNLVGGLVESDCSNHGLFRVHSNKTGSPYLNQYPNLFYDYVPNHEDCVLLDYNNNFFLTKTHHLQNVEGWNEHVLKSENDDLFLRFKVMKSKIAFCKSVTINRHSTDDNFPGKTNDNTQKKDVSFLRYWTFSKSNICSSNSALKYKEFSC